MPLPFLLYVFYCNQPLPPASAPRALPTPNGFVAGFDAVARLTPAPDGSPLVQRDFANPKVLREKLASEKPGLEDLRKSLRLDWGVPEIQDLSQNFPYLARFRDGARKFAAESRLALADKQPAESMDRALDAIELGSRVGQGGPLIHGMVAMSCAAIGADQAERSVAFLSAAEARRARLRLEEVQARYPTAVLALDEERRIALATLRRLFRNELDMQMLAGRKPRDPNRRAPPWYLYPKPWAYREMDRAFRAEIAEAAKLPVNRQPVTPPREILSRTLIPVIDGALPTFDRNHLWLQLLRLELGLREYQKQHGAYPKSLSQLGREFQAAAFVDPYSGKPLIYRGTAAEYLLYSVGPDGEDDGGVPQSRASDKEKVEAGDVVAGKLGRYTR